VCVVYYCLCFICLVVLKHSNPPHPTSFPSVLYVFVMCFGGCVCRVIQILFSCFSPVLRVVGVVGSCKITVNRSCVPSLCK
jgi:hypothetical protein